MLFASNIFLFCFLPIALIGYFIFAPRFRNSWLVLVSLFFYAWGEPRFVIAMMSSILMNYLFAVLIARCQKQEDEEYSTSAKLMLWAAVACNLCLLFIFKYLNFTLANLNIILGNRLPQTNIVLPIGISFFTFQAMSYVIDVYRRRVAVQKNPMVVALYISLFPQLIAGPIVRYSTIEDQIHDRTTNFDDFAVGMKRFVQGLSKKVLLANTLSVLADAAFNFSDPSTRPIALAWLGALAYAFQIYFGFSGYSDMAIGLGRMFGFHFDENFNYPYIAKSISEFWRRWHISLSTWFRDYVYFPLGGSRLKSKGRLVLNLFVVWSLTGFWHGASWNFIVWGLFYFALITMEKLTNGAGSNPSRPAAVRYVYQAFTMLCILLGWVVFRAKDLSAALEYIGCMFGMNSKVILAESGQFYLREYAVLLVVGILASLPLAKWLREKWATRPVLVFTYEISTIVLTLAAFVLSVSYLVVSKHNPFIYFNF